MSASQCGSRTGELGQTGLSINHTNSRVQHTFAHLQWPDLQRILRQTYDSAALMPSL